MVATAVIGNVRDVSPFGGRDHSAACNDTAPIEVALRPAQAARVWTSVALGPITLIFAGKGTSSSLRGGPASSWCRQPPDAGI
jgi:hypothetical protein